MNKMVDEKIKDYGTFLIGALIIAGVQIFPQVQQMYANDPQTALILSFVALIISQIGSRFAVNQVKTEVIE